MDTARVQVVSAWWSKINWTQAVTGLAMLLAWFTGGKINLTADQQLSLVTAIGIAGNVATWVLKTWFTKTVTPSAVTSDQQAGGR